MKGPDFKKQSSTISAARAMQILLAHEFTVATYREVPDIQDTKQAYRKDILDARRKYGEKAAISNTGRSITLVGFHVVSKAPVRVELPLSGMLGHGAVEAIQDKTGITLANG